MDATLQGIRARESLQQPEWQGYDQMPYVHEALENSAPLVQGRDIRSLRSVLAQVASGEAKVIQCGDCAEDINDVNPTDVARKIALLNLLAEALQLAAHQPVLRVGRIAGQFAKPRSQTHECFGEGEIPVYRGDMVNTHSPDPDGRKPDPRRILHGYLAANDIIGHLGWQNGPSRKPLIDPPIWTSHEALLLDFELPMLRRDAEGQMYLGSTHWPWIGERTRSVDGAHVALLAEVFNPVACKIGPSISTTELLALCERLDPNCEPGRLTLIPRMGADLVADKLPRLVETVRAAGHPVIWLTDPMHGNTIAAPCGRKTRIVPTIVKEVSAFQRAVTLAGGVAGGLHLETTPDNVTECVNGVEELGRVGNNYRTLCDPRLTPSQALAVVSIWNK